MRGFRIRKRGPKVVSLKRCDGSLSNAGIVVSGPNSGSLIRRMDGDEMNCCPVELRHVWTGEVASRPKIPPPSMRPNSLISVRRFPAGIAS